MLEKYLYSFYRFFCGLKLAVIVILSTMIISAVGTVYESLYDAETAQALVYNSFYMRATMVLMAINLICVMIDRFPWKKRHLPFLCAHIGILLLMFGALITQKMGIDGSLNLAMGKKDKWVSVSNKDLTLYATQDGTNYREIFAQEVNFLKNPPSEKAPVQISTSDGTVEVVDFYPYAVKKSELVESANAKLDPALRFHLSNDKVKVTEWLIPRGGKNAQLDLGPAQVVFAIADYKHNPEKNEIVLKNSKNEKLSYEVYTKSTKSVKKGFVQAGDVIETGWMGLSLRLLKVLAHAEEKTEYTKLEKPTPMSTSAIAVRFQGESRWMDLNTLLRMFAGQTGYVLSWGNRRIDLGFSLELEKFEMGKYPGTNRAMSYSSVVKTPDNKQVTISMNEPLKFDRYTFYQASYETDEKGQPVASVLSVNYDPGRMLKYLGSLLLVMGFLFLFYFKPWIARGGGSK